MGGTRSKRLQLNMRQPSGEVHELPPRPARKMQALRSGFEHAHAWDTSTYTHIHIHTHTHTHTTQTNTNTLLTTGIRRGPCVASKACMGRLYSCTDVLLNMFVFQSFGQRKRKVCVSKCFKVVHTLLSPDDSHQGSQDLHNNSCDKCVSAPNCVSRINSSSVCVVTR